MYNHRRLSRPSLVATAEMLTVERPLLVQGSALLSAVTMQVSSPTYINGSFSMDSGSLISLTQVSALDGPLLVINGDASFLGTLAVTLDGRAPLRYPLIQVNGEATFSGTFIITLGSVFTDHVRLLIQCIGRDLCVSYTLKECSFKTQTPIVEADVINATDPVSFLLVLHDRPPFVQQSTSSAERNTPLGRHRQAVSH